MRAEDETEFREFVQGRWPALVRTAYLLTGDRHHAEDVAQTALAKAYASWRRVRDSDSPDAYLRRILVTSNADRFRKRRPPEYLTQTLPERPRHDESDPSGRLDQRHVLLSALDELPDRQRAVVVLRYWEDLSEAEVASILGCSVGTVKSQASKGLAKLRVHPQLTDHTWQTTQPEVLNGRLR
ncbi:SigE family RNA polymerase sigma factor [Kitasatospora sp. GP82]|uniref:SigE family RNA polymerase sigma factor n=1 Tax=Kitasatospora sp. GP82 TaxID=3035089 RepID=UPI00247335B6|nr:SigE family RNA polymerase sigma factor [Kitasatospora sp. GP82]MDH6125747.1 RNA polymerase sigma-70 factor (sigma-E family) [Kitasatospora sp. GP82]